MSVIGSLSGYNNLLNATNRNAISNILENRAGHIPLDLRSKKQSPINEVLNMSRGQINGKRGDLKYIPKDTHSRPDYGYDARYDPTILDAVRNKYVDVSGTLIPNKDLRLKNNTNATRKPLIAYGIIK